MTLRFVGAAALLCCSVRVHGEQAYANANTKHNPYEKEGDSTQECYTWVADGQCRLNPRHMLSACKYSCWEWYAHRKAHYPDAPIDKDFHCHAWAENGECANNWDFMKETCFEACKGRSHEPEPAEPKPPKKPRAKRRRGKKGKAKPQGEGAGAGAKEEL